MQHVHCALGSCVHPISSEMQAPTWKRSRLHLKINSPVSHHIIHAPFALITSPMTSI